jgi:hypothetical protein
MPILIVNKNNATKKNKQSVLTDPNNDKIKLLLEEKCKYSNVCLELGRYNYTIKKYFNNFTDLSYIHKIKLINKKGKSGFTNIIQYKKDDYTVDLILKSSLNASQNLGYEYFVGKFINKYNKVFSCFIETYDLLKYNNLKTWEKMKNSTIIKSVLKKNVTPMPNVNIYNINLTCEDPLLLINLTQYVNNSIDLKTLIQHDPLFIAYDLIYILYQIYLPLFYMKKNFTHYDLHTGNVLISQPIKDTYIQYIYYLPNNKIVKFKSKYIAKIIDYGLSYFNDTTQCINSNVIYNSLCFFPQCGTLENKCGNNLGYKFLSNTNNQYLKFNIIPKIKNESADLKLIHMLHTNEFLHKNKNIYIKNFPWLVELYNMVGAVVYGVGIDPDKKQHGTTENLKNDNININNVSDAKERIENILDIYYFQFINNNYYHNIKKCGDLHIYTDGRKMKFIPTKN